MTVTYIPCNPGNYDGARSPGSIRWIVIHYTGTDGGSAKNNGTYFKNNVKKASAHFFVDSTDVVQSVPVERIAWHCGGEIYYNADCRNANSIGVELCDENKDGTIYPTPATIDRALELTRELMARYNIPVDHVIRHWDVTHKLCPAYWCGSAEKNALWRSAFWDRLTEKEDDMKEPRYNTLAEIERDCPWALPTVEKLLARQAILGDGNGLNLSRDMLRLLVICDRAGAYKED